MRSYQLDLVDSSSLDSILEQLSVFNITLLYATEDPDSENAQLVFCHESSQPLPDFLADARPLQLETTIDWEAQWTLSEHYRAGYVYIPNTNLRMRPGPGFGDLTHPTTLLVLELMGEGIKGRSVLDVGCGSGVLSLAAHALGASHVMGTDIDHDALKHAHTNAVLNGLENEVSFCLPNDLDISNLDRPLLLLNMTFGEQKVALEQLSPILPETSQIISSGILTDQAKEYLEFTKTLDWHCIESRESDIWSAFRFKVL